MARDLIVRYHGDVSDLKKSSAAAKSSLTGTAAAAAKLQERYAAAVQSSGRAAKAASATQEAAARKARIEELKLQEVRDSGTAKASQIAAAEDRVARAHVGLSRAQEKSQDSAKRFAAAQGVQASALKQTETVARGFAPRLRAALSAAPGAVGRIGSQMGQRLQAGFKGGVSKLASLAKSGVAGLAVGVAAAGYGIARGLTSAIRAAGDAEQSIGAVDAVFGKYAAGVQKNSRLAAGAVGISANAYRELATSLGSSLKNKGIDDFAGQTKSLIGLGADLAAQYGGTTKEAVEALGSTLRGETDPIERYGVSINQTAIANEAVRLGLAKSKGAVSDQAKAMAALSLINKQTASSQGAFSRENDTYAHKVQVAAARFEDLKVAIGNKFLPIATQAMGFVSDKAIPAISKWVGTTKGLGPVVDQLVPLLGGLSRTAATIFGPATGAGIKGYTKGIRGLIDYVATHQVDMIKGLQAGGNAALDLGQALVDGASNGLAGIGALADGVAGFVESSTAAVGGLIHSAAAIAPLLGPAGVPIAKAAADFDKAQASADGVAAGLRRAGQGARDAGKGLSDELNPKLKETRDRLNATANQEIFKASQRDAAAKFAVAVRDVGTTATGSQIHLKKWSDVSSLGAATQRGLEKRIKGAQSALQGQIGAQQAAGAGQKALTKTWENGRNKLAGEFRQMGLSRKEAGRLADKYAGIKPKVKTTFSTPGLAQAKSDASSLKSFLDRIPRSVKIKIQQETVKKGDRLSAASDRNVSYTGGVWDGRNRSIIKAASGRVLPGWSPGRDIHRFYSATAGELDLSGGEAIMRPEFTAAVGGPSGVARLNRAAQSGNLGGAMSDGGVPALPVGPALAAPRGRSAAVTAQQDQVQALIAAVTALVARPLQVDVTADHTGMKGFVRAIVREELRGTRP